MAELNTSLMTTNHTNSNQGFAHEQKTILYEKESYEINSCIFAVNRKLGTGFNLGLLINFNSYPKAEIIRMIR